jgi:hypothetical protein
MVRLRHLIVSLFLVSSFYSVKSQTELYWGDVIVFSMAAEMGGPCGLPAGSDEISFTFFEGIETGTTFEITDNGWETFAPNYWDDIEGVLQITRTGDDLAPGTMVTLQGQNMGGGNFQYRIIWPDDQWAINEINIPGGNFDLESGDQIYFLTGGEWNNNGGFSRRATYSGRTIYAATLHDEWIANGNTNSSNLHPEVDPCYYQIPSSGAGPYSFVEYIGPMDETGVIGWRERMVPQYLNPVSDCANFLATPQDYTFGPNIEIEEDMAIFCPLCLSCLDWETPLIFDLPSVGLYDVAYTDGIDTFYLTDLEDQDFIYVLVDTTVLDFSLVWVAPAAQIVESTLISIQKLPLQ